MLTTQINSFKKVNYFKEYLESIKIIDLSICNYLIEVDYSGNY